MFPFMFHCCRRCRNAFLHRQDLTAVERMCPDCRVNDSDAPLIDTLDAQDISLEPTLLPTSFDCMLAHFREHDTLEITETLEATSRTQPSEAERESTYQRWGNQCAMAGCSITTSKHEDNNSYQMPIHHNVPRKVYSEPEAATQWVNLYPTCPGHHPTFDKYEYVGHLNVRRGDDGFPTTHPDNLSREL